MASATIPGVYAAALLAVARERGTADAVVTSARKLVDALTPEVVRPLDNPQIGKANAKLTIGGIAANEPKEIYDLLQLLVDRNRLEFASAILREAIRQYEAETGIVHVKVRVATPMSPAFSQQFVDRIRQRRGPGAQLDITVDPSLIGGYTARIGDEYVDASVRRQLVEMRQAMLATPVGDALWSAES
jgi:F-type H+-transporting ATPase subunit delta